MSENVEYLECPCGCGHKLGIIDSDYCDDSIVIGIYSDITRDEDTEGYSLRGDDRQFVSGFIVNREVLEKLKNRIEEARNDE